MGKVIPRKKYRAEISKAIGSREVSNSAYVAGIPFGLEEAVVRHPEGIDRIKSERVNNDQLQRLKNREVCRMLEDKKLGLLFATAILILLLSNIVLGVPDESYGVVTKIVDGGSFDIRIEKADPLIAYSTERITLADIDIPDLGTVEGLQARDLAAAVLLNRRVFLDINNLGNGRDPQGRLVCVLYLSGYYGGPLLSPCYNRIVVDSGLAIVNDSRTNEFNPADWWSKPSRSRPGYNDSAETAISRLEIIAKDLLDPFHKELGRRYEKMSKDAGDWLRKQLRTQ